MPARVYVALPSPQVNATTTPSKKHSKKRKRQVDVQAPESPIGEKRPKVDKSATQKSTPRKGPDDLKRKKHANTNGNVASNDLEDVQGGKEQKRSRSGKNRKDSKGVEDITKASQSTPSTSKVVDVTTPSHEKLSGMVITPSQVPLTTPRESGQKKRRRKRRRDAPDTPSKAEDKENVKIRPESDDSRVPPMATPSQGKNTILKTPEKSQIRKLESKLQKAPTLRTDGTKDGEWKMSAPLGGKLARVAPFLSIDEKYLILAYETSIRIYSASTSLLVRSLAVSANGLVTGAVLSTANPDEVYVTTSGGTIEKWDWKTGIQIGRWNTSSNIHLLSVLSEHLPDKRELFFTVEGQKKSWSVSAHILTGSSIQSQVIKKHGVEISAISITEGGRVVIFASDANITIGRTDLEQITSFDQELNYTWLEFSTAEPVVCLDTRPSSSKSQVLEIRSTPRKGKPRRPTYQPFDLVFGGARGAIFIFEDILNQLILQEARSNRKGERVTARKLHWHREAVLTAKWSKDGNYIISGGQETVLVMWQLSTGHQQVLPHLRASIEGLSISPSGSSYIIRLGDNSVIVLSTSELKPTAHVAGIQSYTPSRRPRVLELVKRIDDEVPVKSPLSIPSVIDPANSSTYLIAVPQSSSIPVPTCLQTLSLQTGTHISFQTLTRTNITDLQTSPENTHIQMPAITQLSMSFDGRYLATVDEWRPPASDTERFNYQPESTGETTVNRQRRKEVALRFWTHKNTSPTMANPHPWDVITLVSSPHVILSSNGQLPASVVALASNPTTSEFASVGQDLVLKLWHPAASRQSWHASATYALPTPAPLTSDFKPASCLAYSADGSALALAMSIFPGTVFIFNVLPSALSLAYAFPNMYTGNITGLAFLSRNLIILSDVGVMVWDIVRDALVYAHAFSKPPSQSQSNHSSHSHSHRKASKAKGRLAASQGYNTSGNDDPSSQLEEPKLAVSIETGTFAVSLPARGVPTMSCPCLLVFSPESAVPVSTFGLPHPVMALSSLKGKEYVILDSAAEMRSVIPAVTVTARSSRQRLLAPPVAVPAIATAEHLEREAETEDVDMNMDLVRGQQDQLQQQQEQEMGVLKSIYGVSTVQETNGRSLLHSLPKEAAPDDVAGVVDVEMEDDYEGARVVRATDLAKAFEKRKGGGLVSLEAMFERVVELFAAR